jgi:DNA-binding NarL/FixJ family response regulator
LAISVKTVETYRSRIMEKLGIHEIAGVVRYAIRHGVVQA